MIAGYPDVFEVAVIGLPDKKWGEVVTAIVAQMPEKQIKAEDIINYCKENLAGYKCPKIVKFVETLPKNPAGKIVKRELKKMFSTS